MSANGSQQAADPMNELAFHAYLSREAPGQTDSDSEENFISVGVSHDSEDIQLRNSRGRDDQHYDGSEHGEYERLGEEQVDEEQRVDIPNTQEDDPTEDEHEDFVPIPVPPAYPELNYIPTILQTEVLSILALAYLSIAAGTGVLYWRSRSHQAYVVENIYIYLGAHFGPAVVAGLTSTLFTNTLQELARLLPYIYMADRKGKPTTKTSPRTIAAMYWPLLQRMNSKASWILFFMRGPTNYLIAYKALLFNISERDQHWIVTVHGLIALLVVCYYTVITSFTVGVACSLWRRETGLRKGWDPTSLADMISLFSWCNIKFEDVTLGEKGHTWPNFEKALAQERFRLGYWERRISQRSDIVYGIRSIGKNNVRICPRLYKQKSNRRTRRAQPGYPYLQTPLINWLFYFNVALSMLLLGYLIFVWSAGYVRNGFILQHDWELHRLDQFNGELPSATGHNVTVSGRVSWLKNIPLVEDVHLRWASIVLRGLPMACAAWLLTYTYTLDAHYRFTQPLVNMTKAPATASESILLNYLTMSPLEVTQEAFKRSHWKVFYFSIFNALSPQLQIIPWGALTLIDTGEVIVGQFSLAFYIGTVTLLVVYIISLLISWPRDRRRVPRKHTSLLDLWVLCYASRLAHDTEFWNPHPNWSKEDLAAALQLRHDKYVLGQLNGMDGKERAGFDVFSTGTACTETGWVEWVKPESWSLQRRKNREQDDVELQPRTGTVLLDDESRNRDV